MIDRNDHVINLCEMKYAGDEFTIDKAYAGTVRERAALFQHVLKTRKDIRITFITPYGIRSNLYSDLADSQVVLDDLFA